MRIMHIIDSGGLYGAEIMLLTLTAEQMKLGQRAVIASIGSKGQNEKPFEREAVRRGIEVLRFRMRNGPNFLGAYEIMCAANELEVDILHSHGYKGNILFGLMPRLFRKYPMVSTLHGWTNTEPFSKLRIYETMDAISLHCIDAIVVVNRAMLNHPRIRKLKRERINVIMNGIPELKIEKAAEPDQQILDFCRQKWTVINIGRLTKEKGHIYLINAFARLLEQGVDAQLLIIGEGPERATLQDRIHKSDLGSRVYLPGYREDAWQYLPLCNVFVLSSLTEGLPITLLEAMQMKIPVIATAVGGIPGLIEDSQSGILINPAEAASIYWSMLKIYQNRQMGISLAERAWSIASKDFTSTKMAFAYNAVYSSLSSKK